MQLEFDSDGYVKAALFGCISGTCTEYTGTVPTQPEAYADICDWVDRAKIQAYKLDSNGNLVYDSAKAATLPNEDDVVLKPYTKEECEALNIAPADHTHGDSFEIQTGLVVGDENVAGGSYKDYPVTFNREFSVIPNVVVGFESSSTAGNFGRCSCAVLLNSATTTGFTIRFFNGDSSNRNPCFNWIAVNFNQAT